MSKHPKLTHLIHVLAVDFDIVDGSGKIEDGDAEDGRGAGLAGELFDSLEFTERYPVVAIERPNRMNGVPSSTST